MGTGWPGQNKGLCQSSSPLISCCLKTAEENKSSIFVIFQHVFLRLVMSALARFSLRVGFSGHHGDGLAGSEQGPVPKLVSSD